MLGTGVLVVATFIAVEVRAAVMEFRPSMSFGVFYDGNIDVVGGSQTNATCVGPGDPAPCCAGPGSGTCTGKQGDEVAALAFDLVWDRSTPTSTLALSYRPSVVVYHQDSANNYFGNTLVVDFSKRFSEASGIKVDTFVDRSERQGQKAATPGSATTYVPRSIQTLASVTVDASHPAGRRGHVDWQARGGVDLYEDVDPTSTTPGVDFNDGSWVGARFDWEGELSERNSLGLGLGGSLFGYENTPNVVVGTLGVVGTSQAGPLWKLDYAFGAQRAKSEGGSDDGFAFDLTVEYESGKTSSLQAGARQAYAPGTGLGGATQDLGAWVSYGHDRPPRGLFGSVLGGYWLRDSLGGASVPTTGDTETFNVQGSIGWEFNRFIALEGAYAFVDQNATNGADSSLDTTYSSYGLYVRWAIRGR